MAMSSTAATLSITQTVALYTVFLPEMTDVRRQTPGQNPAFADDVRYAECAAGVVSLGISGVVCLYEQSWQPLFASLLVAVLLTVAYEVTLRRPGVVPNLFTMPDTRDVSV